MTLIATNCGLRLLDRSGPVLVRNEVKQEGNNAMGK